MADGGIGEAALIAAATEAAGGTAAAAAATLPEVIGAGTALAGTAAAAAPEVAAAAAPELLGAAASAAPVVGDVAASSAPFIGATESAPLLGSAAADTPAATSLLGDVTAIDPNLVDLSLPAGTTLPESAAPGSAPVGLPGSNVFDKLGAWWQTASTGDKLQKGGQLLSAVSTAGKAATPTPSKGPTTTIKPGAVGQPRGGEQALATIVDAMLKKRDAYQQGALGGVPVVYRPRGLLG